MPTLVKRPLNKLEQEAHDLLVGHQVNLLRLSADEQNAVFAILSKMANELSNKLMSADMTAFNKARTQELLTEAKRIIGGHYSDIQKTAFNTLVGVAKIEHQQTVFSTLLDTSIPAESALKAMVSDTVVMGGSAAEWWAKQSGDAQFRFTNIVRQGIAAGDTREAMARKVLGVPGEPGLLGITRANAKALVNTSVAAVAAKARLESYKQNSDVIKGVQQVSTLDSRTTPICAAYADQEWDLAGNPINGSTLPFNGGPPRHWSCRSVLIPIVGLELPPLASKAADNSTVPGNTTFEKWLNSRTVEQQNEQFGPGKMALWRQGKITLQQMLDQSGNPMSLAQLQEAVDAGAVGPKAAAKAKAAAQAATEAAQAKAAQDAALAAQAAAEAQAKAAQAANDAAEAEARFNAAQFAKSEAERQAEEAAAMAKAQAEVEAAAKQLAEQVAAEKVAQEAAKQGPMAALKAWQEKVKAEKAAGTYVKPPLTAKQKAWLEKQKGAAAAKKAASGALPEPKAVAHGIPSDVMAQITKKFGPGGSLSNSHAWEKWGSYTHVPDGYVWPGEKVIAAKYPNNSIAGGTFKDMKVYEKTKGIMPGTTVAPPPPPTSFSSPAPGAGVVKFVTAKEAGIPENLFAKAQKFSQDKYGYKVQIPAGFKLNSDQLSTILNDIDPAQALWKRLNKAYHEAVAQLSAAQKAALDAAKKAEQAKFLKNLPQPVGVPKDLDRFKPLTSAEGQALENDFIQAFAGKAPQWMRDYNNVEARYLELYTGSSYSTYNTALRQWARTGVPPKREETLRAIEAIKKALTKNGLPHDAMLYRGIRHGEAFASELYALAKQDLSKVIGKVITDHGFTSTSISEKFSANWAGGNGLLLQIIAPKGTKGAFVQAISQHKSELEWLLPPGSRMVIERAEWNVRPGYSQPQLKLTVRIIPPL